MGTPSDHFLLCLCEVIRFLGGLIELELTLGITIYGVTLGRFSSRF